MADLVEELAAAANKPQPPPAPDLDTVYNAFEDPTLQDVRPSSSTEVEPQLLTGDAGIDAAALFGDEKPKAASSATGGGLSLIDLNDNRSAELPAPAAPAGGLNLFDDAPAPAPAPAQASGGLDLFDDAPAVARPESTEKPAAVIDLSGAAGAGDGAASKSGAASSGSRKASPPPEPDRRRAKPIPKESKAFGSDDIFGAAPNARGEKNLGDAIQEEAYAAYGNVVKMLPDKVTESLPSCMAPPPEDPDLEIVIEHDAPAGQPNAPPLTMQQQHEMAAVNRACEGRWVPTYMRRQMAENGHHFAIPVAPNAHEYRADQAPPTLGNAMENMGAELGESAQSVFNTIMAVWASLSLQCQMCTNASSADIHDKVFLGCDGLCGGNINEADTEERIVLGRPLDEALAGLGPMRSQVKRTLPNVAFDTLITIIETKLVSPQSPPEFARVVKHRQVSKQVVESTSGVEDWLFNTELNQDALNQFNNVTGTILQHVVPGLNGAMQHAFENQKMRCRELWHIELRDEKAVVEITSEPSKGEVIVVLRIDISGGLGADGRPCCEVDSRLFAQPRRNPVLPIGIVEQLTEAHHVFSESLRDSVLALSQEAIWPEAPQMTPPMSMASAFPQAAAMSSSPPPSMAQMAAQTAQTEAASPPTFMGAPTAAATSAAPAAPFPPVPPSWPGEASMAPAGTSEGAFHGFKLEKNIESSAGEVAFPDRWPDQAQAQAAAA